ncbi:MAG: site-specific integrase [Elusimicrobia bacterium]|nr:site-specific integrase [Elusimicrobiota bacterium]
MAIFRKRGRWWIGYRTADGRRRREPVGPAFALAKEVLAKRLAEVAEGRHFPARVANARIFNQLVDKWWQLHGVNLRSSWGAMLPRVREAFGTRRLAEIRGSDVQTFYNAIAGRTSVANANRYLTLVRSIFNKGRRWGDYHGDNPCSAVQRGREAHHRLRYLSRDEIESLLSHAHPRLYPVLVCALLTGMRRGEILDLDWENVSLDRDTIYILESKSGKPRELPIPGKLHEMLVRLGPRRSGPVFDLPVIMLRRFFDRAVRASRLPAFRFHDLRHTFASHFIMRTNDLPALQALLGHASPTMTQRYAHLSRGHLASEIAAFEAAIPVHPTAPAPAAGLGIPGLPAEKRH